MARTVTVARRFTLAYLALAGLVGCAIGAFVVLERRPAPIPPPPWSSWKPTTSDPVEAQKQIAKHVAARYHLPSGQKLVDVLAGQPGPASDPIRSVAVARTLAPKARSDLREVVDSRQTAMYVLCGPSKTCAIKQTPARVATLRGEALELALYTFRYIDAADSVATFIGPSRVFFVTRAEVSRQLSAPLHTTLPRANAQAVAQFSPTETRAVDALTARRWFDYRFDISTGARVLLLAPPEN